MNRKYRPIRWLGGLGLAGLVSGLALARGADSDSAPPFEEIYGLVESNLVGTTKPELNRAAVTGFVEQLRPKVLLVPSSGETALPDQEGALVSKKTVYENRIGYLRVARVAPGLAEQLTAGCQELTSKKKLDGLILDLRFASGLDYRDAGKAGDLFVTKEQLLLKWGDQNYHATARHQEVPLPLAVLVNQKTAGAAEALAALLRETGAGMLVGGQTAGQALVYQEYTLSNGQKLRISTSTVKTAGQLQLTAQGLKPDIAVNVNLESQQTYYEDAFAQLEPAAAPRQRAARRINEAELVRRQSNEKFFEAVPPEEADSSGDDTPTIQDPVLLRALDLLKALAAVHPFLQRP